MENKNLENLIKKVQISLTKEEKSSLKRNLISYISDSRDKPAVYQRPNLGSYWSFVFSRYSVALFALVFFSAGTSYAAQSALPGDLLYPVKTQINEKVAGILSTAPEAKAKRSAFLLERLLQETRTLIDRDQLSLERRLIIEKQFEKHQSNIRNYISVLSSRENQDEILALQSDLETVLEINEKIITGAAVSLKEAQPIAQKVKEELDLISQNRTETRKILDEKPVAGALLIAQDRMKLALKNLEEVEKLYSQKISTQSQLQVSQDSAFSRSLSEAKQKIREGETLMEVGLYRDALDLFNDAIKILKEFREFEKSGGLLEAEDNGTMENPKGLIQIPGTEETAGSVLGEIKVEADNINLKKIQGSNPDVGYRPDNL